MNHSLDLLATNFKVQNRDSQPRVGNEFEPENELAPRHTIHSVARVHRAQLFSLKKLVSRWILRVLLNQRQLAIDQIDNGFRLKEGVILGCMLRGVTWHPEHSAWADSNRAHSARADSNQAHSSRAVSNRAHSARADSNRTHSARADSN